jgi:Domain of Unknown Function (DUF1080)
MPGWGTAGLLGLALMTAAQEEAAVDVRTIFDGRSAAGWLINTTGAPLPEANVQEDGLNPHQSGGYIVMYETPVADFVLGFDYKLAPGCNSGVFLRVADPKDPVMTGLEVALDDTIGSGLHDSGAFYDLVPPKVNAQEPAGQWNHMTIAARGPKIAVTLNGQDVCRIDLDRWTEPGKRPDGSSHKFTGVVIGAMNRPGYFGFQDHGQDCWFKDVRLQALK